jgi:ribonuclease Z
MRLAGAGLFPSMLSAVLVTHLHSDHVCALADLVTTHWVMSMGTGTLEVYGPDGTAELVGRTLDGLSPDIGYRMAHHEQLERPPSVEAVELHDGDRVTIGGVSVEVAPTEHPPVRPTLGYRLEHDGTVAALVGDTLPCEGVDRLCAGADVYVQTVIRRDLVEQIPNPMVQDILDYHSGVEQAAQTAARAGVGTLVMTHMVPAPQPADYDQWRALAAEHFDGEVVIGDDLTRIEAGGA